MKKKIIISLILVCLCTSGISCPVHAEEEYENEWNYSEEYTEDEYNDGNDYYDEYYYNEENDGTEENDEYDDENTEYYYEEEAETLTEENSVEETTEFSVIEEISVTEEPSVIQESVSEMPSEISEEKSIVNEVSPLETSMEETAEEPEMPETNEPRILNLAFTAVKEDKQADRISGTALWGIVFVLTVFSIIFLPKTGGIELLKDRYRYRKAKKITKRHIR